MPQSAIAELSLKRQLLENQRPRPGETVSARRTRESKLVFATADRFLDRGVDGPMHLNDPRAAKIVEDSILFRARERYDLFAWCVMSNHVHVLFTPRWVQRESTKGIKGFTAYEINGLQGVRGRVFWQDESYDHWSRDETEMLRIIRYIENNPVADHLCPRPEDWPWSSARLRENWPPGQVYKHEQDAGDPS